MPWSWASELNHLCLALRLEICHLGHKSGLSANATSSVLVGPRWKISGINTKLNIEI